GAGGEGGGDARAVQPVAVDIGRHVRDLQQLHVLDAAGAEDTSHGLRRAPHLPYGEAGGRDAGDADQLGQGVLEGVEVRVEIAQRGLAGGRLAGAHRFSKARRSPSPINIAPVTPSIQRRNTLLPSSAAKRSTNTA